MYMQIRTHAIFHVHLVKNFDGEIQQCAKNHDIPDVCCVTSIVQEFICPKNICPVLMSFNLIAYITCCKSNKSVCKTGKLNGSNSLTFSVSMCKHITVTYTSWCCIYSFRFMLLTAKESKF